MYFPPEFLAKLSWQWCDRLVKYRETSAIRIRETRETPRRETRETPTKPCDELVALTASRGVQSEDTVHSD